MYNYDTANYHYRFYPPTVALIYTCFHVLFDLIILAIPLPFLLRMKLRRSKKGSFKVTRIILWGRIGGVSRIAHDADFFSQSTQLDFYPFTLSRSLV